MSFLGAMFILVGYVGHQLHWLDPRKPFYNLVNLFGAGILAYVALRPLQVGFAILEVVWMAVSLLALYRSLRPRQP
ncbi:MAG TPA: hypothetical protein VGQ71_10750 [Terriglobales bacterium]|nr:hypothetical protein [Terriglobales bacterium]